MENLTTIIKEAKEVNAYSIWFSLEEINNQKITKINFYDKKRKPVKRYSLEEEVFSYHFEFVKEYIDKCDGWMDEKYWGDTKMYAKFEYEQNSLSFQKCSSNKVFTLFIIK